MNSALVNEARHSQTNPIELNFNPWIEFDRNRLKSNSHKNNWTVEVNRTFDFRTLDFCKTVVEISNKAFEAQATSKGGTMFP